MISIEQTFISQEMGRLRPELGDFSSIIFLKAILIGIEEALGDKTAGIAMISAGRNQGKHLAKDLNLVGNQAILSLEEIQDKINLVLGKQGTRLCLIDKIELEGDIYKVYAKETFCSAGEAQGSLRNCTYTLGVIQGFLETLLKMRLHGKQIESVLRGGSHDVFEFNIIA
jgi:predicted hydrocarbon binding protein